MKLPEAMIHTHLYKCVYGRCVVGWSTIGCNNRWHVWRMTRCKDQADKFELLLYNTSDTLFHAGIKVEPCWLTHHGPVPHICVAIFSAYFRSAPDMWRWFQCSFPQCPIHGAWQTARSSPVPQIVVARPHLLSHQRPIYVARHGPLSLHVLCGKY